MKKLQFLGLGIFFLAALTQAQEWVEKKGLEQNSRNHPVSWAIDGFGYSVTGMTETSAGTKDFFKYDPTTDEWEELQGFPGTARSYSIGGVYQGEGYLGFGSSSTSLLNDLWKYNPQTQQWTQLASCPCDGRQHPAFTINEQYGKIYIGQGNDDFSNLKDWWEYDIATNTWSQKANFPGTQRHHPYHFSIGQYSYTGLGHDDSFEMAREDLYRYNPEDGTWLKMANAPGGRIAGTQFAYNGFGFVLSGDGDYHLSSDPSIFWKYDPQTNSWDELIPHPGESLWAPGSFIIDGMLYFFGGVDRSGFDEVYFEDMWACDLNSILGVSDPVQAYTPFTIAPNPVSDLLEIDMKQSQSAKYTVEIYDATGKSILKQNMEISPIQINVQQFNPGIYIVKLTTDKGKIYTQKLIKK